MNLADPSQLVVEPDLEDISGTLIETMENGMILVAGGDNSVNGLVDFSDLDNPIVYEEPKISRRYDTGVIVDDVWLRPAVHVLDVVSLECRPPEAEIRTAGTGLTIWFEDLSRYQVTERLWDFGDGETSSELNPVHTYARSGDYTVTLTISSPNGTDSTSQIITAGPPRVRKQPPDSRRH